MSQMDTSAAFEFSFVLYKDHLVEMFHSISNHSMTEIQLLLSTQCKVSSWQELRS